MRVCGILQARMGSTRLPGKVLKPVLGKALLEHQVERVRQAATLDGLVIATSDLPQDDPIADLFRKSVIVFRGSEADVLDRYYRAAMAIQPQPTHIVRITGDCPLIDPEVVDEVVRLGLRSGADYASNTLHRRTYPRGLDTEIFTFEALERAHAAARPGPEREHVTLHMYSSPGYSTVGLTHVEDLSHHRWTVDTPEDLAFVTRVLERLLPEQPAFRMDDVLKLLQENPSWVHLELHPPKR